MSRYDGELQMFVSSARGISTERAKFSRWLAERDGRAMGPSGGSLAGALEMDTTESAKRARLYEERGYLLPVNGTLKLQIEGILADAREEPLSSLSGNGSVKKGYPGARYDTGLHMFVHEKREPDYGRLKFLRWLAEQDRLEHGVSGPASGEFVKVKADSIQLTLAV